MILNGTRYSGPIVNGLRQGGSAAVDPYAQFSDNFDSGPSAPGDRGWSFYNSAVLAGASVSGGVLRHLPTAGGAAGSFWYNNNTGYLIYKTIGARQIQARIRAMATNAAGDALPPLGVGSTYRLFGLAAHNPDRSANLNYVHVAVGGAAGIYSMETKSTVNSVSTFPTVATPAVFPWTCDLLLVRDGDDWTSSYRNEPTVPLSSDDDWVEHVTVSRPDLPLELQWGLMAYASTSTADIGGTVDAVEFASL